MIIKRADSFKRQYKKLKKSGYNMTLLDQAIAAVYYNDRPILKKLKDHPLRGKFNGDRELHIQGDWLLRYNIDADRLTLLLLATGTHRNVLGIE
ncbi:type II toxin-antitoxin system YafQ family toxin [Lactobacillus sp. CC-MHH1034]|uniref:type II toxin-antitoxin system YafQ family toxin n=1 Tax=Agrilactobacillus fermenti TaxID=2586909 RepID=UPI001E5B05DD|nr:type II toxin-antitoxin system YafQ family toxin [Agrilactobacillus fermenti]MCD2256040.1 type II toxin-antitoxin system YafQ family toxin [Agrilactobacillus fermenti]